MNKSSLVSVLLPAGKDRRFLAEAVESIKKQTYKSIELLVGEDKKEQGITITLNQLAQKAKGDFLARMDADDICEPDRIEKQVKFLMSNPEVMLAGSWAALIDESGQRIGLQRMPSSWEEIKRQAFYRNPSIHPSWMMRKKWFLKVGGYNEKYRYSQDWEFVLQRVWTDRMENIPESLIKLRIHPQSSSFAANKQQLYFGMRAQLSALKRGDVARWKIIFLFPKLFSVFIPTKIKYFFRSEIFGTTIVAPNIFGIVLPMGQNRSLLEKSGQWSLWRIELEFYRKKLEGVELFEYRYNDWRRYVEALLMPIIQSGRFRRCRILKVVHLTGVIPCLISKLLYRTNYVLSYGYRYDKFAAVEKKWGAWLFSKILTPVAIKFADVVMVPTKALADFVEMAGARRIEIISNGVDTGCFVPSSKFKVQSSKLITVLFVGRLERQKNLETLIRAASEVFKGRALLRLVFVGAGSQKDRLVELSDKLQVDLEIIGPVPNEKLPEIYRRADIFVLPSLVEGHPKALLEAMSCGLPCLASNIAGVNEIINGNNGLLAEPTAEGISAGLKRLIFDDDLRKRLGKAARETVIEKFDKEKLMKREIRSLTARRLLKKYMKILFVLENTMENLEGGTEVSSRHLAGLLKRKGVEVEEWAPFSSRKLIFWYTSIFGQIYILIVLAWKLVKSRVQILHVQGKYLIPPVIILGKVLRIPTVITIRDYIVVCPIGLCLFGFNKGPALPRQGRALSENRHGLWFFLTKEVPKFLSLYHAKDHLMIRIIRYILLIRGWLVTEWLRFWLKKADAVVAVSKYVQEVLANYGIKSQVIHNSFDPIFAAQSNKARPPEVGPLNTVVFVGKPSYGKGYDLFRSLSRNKLFEKYRFVTIGGDSKLPYLETLQKIGGAAAVVVPSRWPEPFGRVAMEALVMGTPVLGTAQGALPEVVEDGVTGVLSEISAGSLAKSLKKIIDANVRFRENIQSRQGQLIEKFVKTPAEKHMRLYLSLLS